MNKLTLFIPFIIFGCSNNNQNNDLKSNFTKQEILRELDLAFHQTPGDYFPPASSNVYLYNFIFDLEHGYMLNAHSKIHLYADQSRWAIVLETNGYYHRRQSMDMNLYYFGNCIELIRESHSNRDYISNLSINSLIDWKEFDRIHVYKDDQSENFELIDPRVKTIEIRETTVNFPQDKKTYEDLGIEIRTDYNESGLISFENIVRFLNEKHPSLTEANEDELRAYIPNNLNKILSINEFHYQGYDDGGILPSEQETYQLLAEILTNLDASLWKPTKKPNNHWSNWESGNL